jgi:S1-C subfamily serine protease
VPTQGLGFAIPAEIVRSNVEQFKKIAAKQPAPSKANPVETESSGSNTERLFGMQLQQLTAQLTTAFGFAPGKGVLISAVEAGSPADLAGIERGLVLYRVGKYDVNSIKQVETLLARAASGTTVDFTVGIVRAGGRGEKVETVSLEAR